jgi:uncharacterized protein
MEIQFSFDGKKGSFFIKGKDGILAEMVYTLAAPITMIIEHTDVSKELEGKGIGKQLVSAAVNHARKNHLKIMPLCPFTKAVMDKKPEEYKDVRV